jgi:two-component system cell cycle sensor histidine kinase/response regulator CckA
MPTPGRGHSVAATTDVRVRLVPAGGLSLDDLPFPAALVSADGSFTATNIRWDEAYPAAPAGSQAAVWGAKLHCDIPDLHESLADGIQQVTSGALPQFVQHRGPGGRQGCLVVSPVTSGALVQVIDPVPQDSAGERDQQSQRMEMVGRLVGGVAHDFANLLTLIGGYAEIVLNRIGAKDPLRPEIDEIRKASNRGARLTAQLLGFTRGHTAEPRPIDLNTLVCDMERMLRPLIGEHVNIETSLAADLGKIVADPGQMEQVLMNLLLNARDAMPGGGKVRIETRNQELDETTAQEHGVKAGPCVFLSITDTGEGIDPTAIDLVFEPFFTTKEKGKGTGLGLSTVQNIVRQSGGNIWVKSVPGEGASFTLCLPATQQAGEGSGPGVASRIEESGGETVLLVEDEADVRRLLSHVLRRRRYRVVEASNGEEALHAFAQSPGEFHLVLTDMVMPGMSGRELGERLRAVRPDARVMYMSGYTDDVLISTGALDPGMSFLQKPLRPDVLLKKIREALDSPSRPFNRQ